METHRFFFIKNTVYEKIKKYREQLFAFGFFTTACGTIISAMMIRRRAYGIAFH